MGCFRFSFAGEALGDPFDLYAPTQGRAPIVNDAEMLGDVVLAAGEHVFAVEVVGKHADSAGFLLGIDYFKLVPLP
jgi:hypothetical protein